MSVHGVFGIFLLGVLGSGTSAPPAAVAPEPPPALTVVLERQGSSPALHAELRFESLGSAVEVQPVEVDAPGQRALNLPAGRWSVRAVAAGLWSPAVAFEVPRDRLVRLQLQPAAVLTAKVDVPRNERPPERLSVHFKTPPATGKSVAGPAVEGEEICPVREGLWRCTIAAGRWDLRLKSEGMVPVYRWGVEASPQGESRLDPLALRRGASIAGWIEAPGGSPAGARVTLHPASRGVPERPGALERLESLDRAETANDRGFFQLSGIPAGAYVLTATLPGYAPGEVSPLLVREGLESQLLQPLVLSRPIAFTLTLDPPADPYGQRWNIELYQQLQGAAKARGKSYRGPAGEDGTWLQPGLNPGRYRLYVTAEGGASRWAAEDVDLRPDSSSLRLAIPLLEVHGRVSLGKEPLAATLWFGGKSGGKRVRFDSDENGKFQGFLPNEGKWPVEIEKEAEGLRLALHPLEVKKRPGKRWAEVELPVPDTLLRGEVVDEAGHAAAAANVSAFVATDRAYSRWVTDPQGRFILRGLPAGPAIFEAEAEERTSGAVTWTLDDGKESPFLRLTVRERKPIEGHVLSPSGPVAGAEILAWPDFTQAGMSGVESSVTGPDGAFRLSVPAGSQGLNLVAFAPGQALRMARFTIDVSRPLDIPVDSQGGTLVVVLPPLAAGVAGKSPLLFHNGTFAMLSLLARWVTLQGGQAGAAGRVLLENVEPGEYSLCVNNGRVQGAPAVNCKAGTVTAGGTLELQAPG